MHILENCVVISFFLSFSFHAWAGFFFLSDRVNNILCNDLLNGVRSKMSTNIQLHSGFDTVFISRDGLWVECVDVTKSHYWCWCLLLVLLLLSLLLLQLLLLYLLLLFIRSECMFLEMASFLLFRINFHFFMTIKHLVGILYLDSNLDSYAWGILMAIRWSWQFYVLYSHYIRVTHHHISPITPKISTTEEEKKNDGKIEMK